MLPFLDPAISTQLILWDRESQMTELDGNHTSPLPATKTDDL